MEQAFQDELEQTVWEPDTEEIKEQDFTGKDCEIHSDNDDEEELLFESLIQTHTIKKFEGGIL